MSFRWNSCKQNKHGANNRACSANPSQTPSPEAEKLHSDSGISVDIQSLQEAQGPPHAGTNTTCWKLAIVLQLFSVRVSTDNGFQLTENAFHVQNMTLFSNPAKAAIHPVNIVNVESVRL